VFSARRFSGTRPNVNAILEAMSCAVRDLATVTPDQLTTLGIVAPRALSEGDIALWQSTPNAKYHWADKRSRCQYLPGYRWGGEREMAPGVSHRVPALGFGLPEPEICAHCAPQIAISTHADAFITVAAEIIRAAQWTQVGRKAALDGNWTWLQFSRWRAGQPLQGDQWMDTVSSMRGPQWAPHAAALRHGIARYRDASSTVIQSLVTSIRHDAGATALLERAVRMVETDTQALSESGQIRAISGCRHTKPWLYSPYAPPAEVYEQPSPWHLVAAGWVYSQQRDLSVPADTLAGALAEQLDDFFPHVHDLRLLDCVRFNEPLEPGDCLHDWAARTARAHLRAVVGEWINRLEMALDGLRDTGPGKSSECTHLVLVDDWPLTADSKESVAYLSQFEVVGRPYSTSSNFHGPQQLAVLRVPEWAAAHVAELVRPMPCERITDEPSQAVTLLRTAGVAIVDDEFTGRHRPSRRLVDARQHLHHETTASAMYPYRRYHRPLHADAVPPDNYGDREWTRYSVLHVLEPGAVFVYGYDRIDLLKMALPPGGHAALRASAEVELQTKCRSPFHDDGRHLCKVQGTIVGVKDNGGLHFIPEGMYDTVTIPPGYLVGLTVTR
jgi:hypothetical protein